MISKYLESMKPEQRKKAVKISLIVVVVVLALVAYKGTRSGKKTLPAKKVDTKEITFDPKLLEKSLFEESRKDIAKKESEMKAMKYQIENLQKALEREKERSLEAPLPVESPALPNTGKILSQTKPPLPGTLPSATAGPGNTPGVVAPPPPAGFPQPSPNAPIPPGSSGPFAQQGQPGQQNQPNLVGGIGVVNQPEVKKNDGEKKPGDKDAKNKIFLPPSFMEATLLSGINAPTLEAAKSQPRPVFLRVKDLAILPNSIKTNLKGCFVIAEGNGDLSDERVHLRLITLSCLAKDGRAVVNAPVKGFVIDSDGVIGLKGNVVTKMGALLGRSIMAGFFGGVGDAVKASTQTTSISPLGTTQTLDPNQVLAAGIGAGVSSGFQKLQDFYLDMARQTFPVVEVGATKTVTLVFSEGVELSINKYCISGIEECQEEEDDTKQS